MSEPLRIGYPVLPELDDPNYGLALQRNFDDLALLGGNLQPKTASGTTFPTSPYEGQKFTYVADSTNGVLWTFEYHATGSSYDWWFTGGPPLFAEVATQENTGSANYAALTTAGPSITLPLTGDYMVQQGAAIYNSSNAIIYMSYDIGASTATDADGILHYSGAGTNPINTAVTRIRRKTGLAASALVSKYKTSAGTAVFENRWMSVTPVRVG